MLRANGFTVFEGQMLLQPLEEGFVGKHLVQNLSSIIHKDEFDTLLDAWWDVFVDVRLACCRDDELCRNRLRNGQQADS